MNPTLLLNRNFELAPDGWIQVVPAGEFPHPSGVIQVIDDQATAAMVQDFRNRAAAENFPGLLVDFDHFSASADSPSAAAGWITELENRQAGIWAKVRWSDIGEAAAKGGRYRLVSPVFSAKEVDRLGNRRVRVKRLLSVALTNDPNMVTIPPISNRAEPGGSADSETETNNKKTMKNIAAKLGLSAEASEDAILAEVTKLINRATTAEQAVEPLQTENARLKTEHEALVNAQVETDLETYKNRFKPEAREKWKAALLANRAGALELLDSMPAAAQASAAQLPNRASAKTPTGTPSGSDPQARAQKAAELIEDYRLSNRCSHEVAHNHIRRKHPELFGL